MPEPIFINKDFIFFHFSASTCFFFISCTFSEIRLDLSTLSECWRFLKSETLKMKIKTFVHHLVTHNTNVRINPFYWVSKSNYPAKTGSFDFKSVSSGVTRVTASSLLESSISLVSSLSISLRPLSDSSSISESLGESLGSTGNGFWIKDLGGGNGGGSSSLSLALAPLFCKSAPFDKYDALSSGKPS